MGQVRRTAVKIASAMLTPVVLWLAPQLSAAAPQGRPVPEARPLSFEVASVRLNTSGTFGLAPLSVRPNGTVLASNVPLRGLIMFAYGLAPHDRIEGKGDFLEARFDVEAKAAAPHSVASPGEIGPLNVMMQSLLAERFGLVIRWEDRLRDGYALGRSRVDGRLGPGLRPSDLECPRTIPKPDEARSCDMQITDNVLTVEGHRMADFTRLLARYYERPVVDRTGLEGWFAFRLRFNARDLPITQRLSVGQPQRDINPGLPSLFTALQEELGLKLEPQQVTIPALIIEQVHALKEN
jgi:uncharacterized protein (TIGR03435 family)